MVNKMMCPSKAEYSNLSSMTGYGRANGESSVGRIVVEARSLNHRYLEVVVRAPKTIMYIDPDVRALVKERVSRGKVEVFITMEDHQDGFTLDSGRAMELAKNLQGIADALGDKVRLEHILTAGEAIFAGETEVSPEAVNKVLETVEKALDSMLQHRSMEGKSLAKDLTTRMLELGSLVEMIEKLAPQVPERIRHQIDQFLSGRDFTDRVDPERLEVEIALMAQRSDVTEEITRLNTHISAFSNTIEQGGVAGRRMDFLLQEIQREINTVGSKSSHTGISQIVVDFKTGLEKVREQVQNIE
jgi:uncharacterized protein (TIGR00255 family)